MFSSRKVHRECFEKYYAERGMLPKNSTESSINFDFVSKGNLSKASFADLLDTSELEILLQHLKKNKHKVLTFTPEGVEPISLNRTNSKKNNINVEVKSFKYKIEIITKRPAVTEKVESDRALPTLSSVIKFWNMYMKSNPKSNKEYYNNEMTTKKVTPEPRPAVYSEEADSISKVLESLVSNKGTNSDQISERPLQNKNKRFFNKLNHGPHIDGRIKIINENNVPKQENIKYVFPEPVNLHALNDLSFKGLLKNIYKLFEKPQTGNENKPIRKTMEVNTPKNKPNKQDNVHEDRPHNEANSPNHNLDKHVLNNNPLNKKLNLIKSLLANFQINKFKDNEDISETIARLEQLGKDEACPSFTTLPLKSNLSGDQEVSPSPLSGLLYDVINSATTAPSLENTNYFQENTEQYQKLQHYNAHPEKNRNYFEQDTEHYEKFMQEYIVPSPQNIIYIERTTEEPRKFKQQFEVQPEENENYSEQITERYKKIIHYNAPPFQSINYFEPNIEQPQNFLQHYSVPLNSHTKKNLTFVDDLANSSYKNTKSPTPQRLPLQEIVFTTPGVSTTINNEKFLHPDVMKEIAENVKKLVLNDIQDRILAITKPPLTTEITTNMFFSKLNSTSNVDNQIIPNAIKLIPSKLQPINITSKSLINSPSDEIDASTTADMFAASLTKIDSEKLKQATLIIEKFIELFKHIKLMQEIKSMAATTTPATHKNTTYTELMEMQPQQNIPVLMHSSGYIPPNAFFSKLQAKAGPYNLLQKELQAKPGPYELLQEQNAFDLMLEARKRALDIYSQSVEPQHTPVIAEQASNLPISFEAGLPAPFPFNMKMQSPTILPIIINPYAHALQQLPFHNVNMLQQHVTNDTPNINKLNKSITIHQTDGAIAPIQMVNPMGLNKHIILSSPVPLGLAKDEKNRWDIMIKYGKSQAEIKDVESRKHILSTYSNTPHHTENSSHELGNTPQNLSINNNVPLFKQNRKQYINDFRIHFNHDGTSTAAKQDPVPQLKNDVNMSNCEQMKKEDPKNSNFQDLLTEVEKIAKVFGYKSGGEDTTKCWNRVVDNTEQNQYGDKIAEVLEYQTILDDKIKSLNIADIENQNSSHNFMAKNIAKAFEEKLHNEENQNIGIDYHSKLNPLDYRSKLDPRILHLNQMARILRANDKEQVFSNVFKRVYTPQKLQNIYTRRKSPNDNNAPQGTPNHGDNVMGAMDSFKNKEYREKGISYDRRFNSDGANSGKIPVGYHEKLERFEERSQYKDKDWQSAPNARPLTPISNIISLPKYNDEPFKNFLKTQQKVNKILERILATRTDDAARSTETI